MQIWALAESCRIAIPNAALIDARTISWRLLLRFTDESNICSPGINLSSLCVRSAGIERRRVTGRFANDEFGVHSERGLLRVVYFVSDQPKQQCCGRLTHVAQRLTNGGQGRVVR